MSNKTWRTLHCQQKHTEMEQDGVIALTPGWTGLALLALLASREGVTWKKKKGGDMHRYVVISLPRFPCFSMPPLWATESRGRRDEAVVCLCVCVYVCMCVCAEVSRSLRVVPLRPSGAGAEVSPSHSVMLMSLGGAWPAVGCECLVVAVAARFT